MPAKELRFEATRSSGKVSALLMLPRGAKWLLVFAHGAGAGMKHAFMTKLSDRLAEHGIGTFRYQFPYMEKHSKRPDPKPILFGTVRSAISTAEKLSGGLPLLAGGKSMGGRMTSMAAAEDPLPNVRGVVFFGFPLHLAGQPSTERAEHLQRVSVPMLFLQGTRDALADLTLLKPICKKLGKRARLHIVDGADHSFHVLKSSGRNDHEVLDDLARITRSWTETLP
jgi:predicted alpha/beta-hydrolase family hydrolase